MTELILLIDDDDSLRRVTEYNLTSGGFRVVTADSGRKGLSLFSESQPDLVVTDVKLGDMNGLELLEKIKESQPETPVIIMTAFGTIEMAVKAMRKGAFHFITKPFEHADHPCRMITFCCVVAQYSPPKGFTSTL